MKKNIIIITCLFLFSIVAYTQVLATDGANTLEFANQSLRHRLDITSGGWARSFKIGVNNLGVESYGAFGVVGNAANNTTNYLYLDATGNPAYNNLKQLRLYSNGNVSVREGNLGVGTTAPSQKLDVIGSVKYSDKLFIANNKGVLWNNAGFTELQATSNSVGLSLKTTVNTPIVFSTNGNLEKMRINANGNVGIGTNSPTAKFHINAVNSNGNYNTTFDGNSMQFENGGQSSYIRKLDTGRLFFSIGDSQNFVMSMSNNGNIGIGTGTSNPDEKLTVKGKIHTEEVRVDLLVPGPDYVFEKYYNGVSKLNPDYSMPTLKEVEAFTKANKHLPNVPSAKEMKANGVQLKEMNLKLLQKIEELTLYAIEQQKALEALNVSKVKQQKEIEEQNEKNKRLEIRLNKIDALLNTSKK